MNLKYLFELQGGLMANIKKQHKLEEISFDKTVLALLVEVGECANEWQGFKYWKKDNSPKKYYKNKTADDGLCLLPDYGNPYTKTLEEYVDGLHFVIQLGILIGFEAFDTIGIAPKKEDIESMYKEVYRRAIYFDLLKDSFRYSMLFDAYLTLGMMLGFTEKEIEFAYIQKNRTNHHRQLTGY